MRDVLVIGCGNIAGRFDEGREGPPLTHAGAFAAHPGFRVAACVEPDAERRAAFAARWGVPRAVGDTGELAGAKFDLVSICSPTGRHADDVATALQFGPAAIFCEKPIAPEVAEAQRVAALCEAAGVALAVNYTRRWAPDVVALAADLRDGKWGALRSAMGVYTKGVVHNGGHLIDLIALLAGPLELVAAGRPVFDHWPDDPSVPALLATEAGVPVQLGVGDARDYALFELTLVTEQGEIAMRDGGARWTTRRADADPVFAGYRRLGPETSVPGRYDEAMGAAVANIADHLDHGAPLVSTAANALAAQRLCEAIRAAALA